MALPLRTLLTQPAIPWASFHHLPGAEGTSSLSKKNWVAPYELIPSQYLNLVRNPDFNEIDNVLGAEDELDRLLLSRTVYMHNHIPEALQNEADSVRAFYTHISLPIQLAFQGIIIQRSEAGPLGPTNYSQTVDFTWSHGDRCVLVGELKRHGIIADESWLNRIDSDPDHNRRLLSKEMRGYCHRYNSFLATVFDGKYLLVLIFKANSESDIQAANCPVEGFIFHHENPMLRYGLFRAASQQLRRIQALEAPALHLDGYTRHFHPWSGTPYWMDAQRSVYTVHPKGHMRHLDPQTGAWYWHTRDGPVKDTEKLW
ncbi:hypothetical protein F5Y14DRAFT_53349 [Nemania sp. NC0429]|nr:hypothetical protein F5Y14DRAFT_53349 [Nemania sp. NC0429]